MDRVGTPRRSFYVFFRVLVVPKIAYLEIELSIASHTLQFTSTLSKKHSV